MSAYKTRLCTEKDKEEKSPQVIVKKKPGCNIIISLQRGIHEHLTPPPFATPLKFIATPPVWYAGPLQKGAQNWTSFLDRVAVFIYFRSWGQSDCKCEVFSFFPKRTIRQASKLRRNAWSHIITVKSRRSNPVVKLPLCTETKLGCQNIKQIPCQCYRASV